MTIDSKRAPRGQGRETLLGAAQRLIARDGANAVTVRGVAREAGLSIPLISYYFAGRAGLIEEAFDAHVSRVETLAERVTTTGRRGIEAGLRAVFADRSHVLVRHELHIEAARSGIYGVPFHRSRSAMSRIVSAGLHASGHSTETRRTARGAMAELESIAMTTAVEHSDDGLYTAAMIAYLGVTFGDVRGPSGPASSSKKSASGTHLCP
ncbi:TetR family transcriptional regulator [Williamsia herbipolensis]|uniref:TetR family transcriptional regulator n=1 Tax=Williamsia herbipolensis TaxID=1603258 RepID=A0AAU4JYG6_9NOCA|nr:TetR family transcriptional regulator [Williamsia herbipolensis]